MERARPRDGLGVRVRVGFCADLLGDFGFVRGAFCVGRGFSDLEERL